ncbi:hypothetical protein LCGC14_1155830 [marine sediment metagenome]|uniref:Uncharacterized protein n=1 Tax=marine sediment metagenome TaxID=412755 RepID=A0A0F9PZM0_9ZZZZ
MTLENCHRLLKHFNDLADGTIPKPFGHKDWADVVHNAKLRALSMQKKIGELENPQFRTARGLPEVVKEKPEENKPKEKKDGKK